MSRRIPISSAFFAACSALLELVIPRFVQEGKKYATIAVGCTGGRHRSVHIAERLARELKAASSLGMDALQVNVTHRELERHAALSCDTPGRRPPGLLGKV